MRSLGHMDPWDCYPPVGRAQSGLQGTLSLPFPGQGYGCESKSHER